MVHRNPSINMAARTVLSHGRSAACRNRWTWPDRWILGLDLQALVRAGARAPGVTAERALARGLAQQVSTDPVCLVDRDLVILALPMARLLEPDPACLALPSSAVVTDVGSVKAPVLDLWRTLHPRFVASHPMAGTAQAGVEAGQTGLFRDALIATPTGRPIQTRFA